MEVPLGANLRADFFADGAPYAGYDWYVEGLEPGGVILELKQHGNGPVASDHVRLGVLGVKSVAWEALPTTNLDENSNIGGGLRIFPDQDNPADGVDRRWIGVRVRVTPQVPDVRVWLAVFDVDDPSFGSHPIITPVDAEVGPDNRGDSGFAPFEAGGVTDADGAVATQFRVSSQPGDNWRIVAGMRFPTVWLNTLVAPQDRDDADVWDERGTSVPNRCKSAPLTTWRRLWIERDTMAAPQSSDLTVFSGTSVATIIPNEPIPGQSTVSLGLNLDDSLSDLNHFEGGTIKFTACPDDPFHVISSTSAAFENDSVVIEGLPGACATDSAWTLVDDDNPTILPHAPDGGTLLRAAFAEAYVVPSYLDSQYTDLVPFQMHLTDNAVRFSQGSWEDGVDLTSTASFWHCLVVGCWQPHEDADLDPDTCPMPGLPGAEGGQMGLTNDYGEVAIFLQTIADEALCGTGTDEAHVVTHEIGHTCDAHNGNYHPWRDGFYQSIMEEGAPITQNRFHPNSIERFRRVTKW